MKYGKILTYKDVEEAKRLIGKKIAVSDSLKMITETPNRYLHVILKGITEGVAFPFQCDKKYNWQFAREIEEEFPERMTHRQLAEWLARGFGQMRFNLSDSVPQTSFSYFLEKEENEEVDEEYRICTWDSEEWIVPTFEIYERDCRK